MKKLLSVIGILMLGFLSWNLLLKPYDYLVEITVNTFPGTINQSIKTWNMTLDDAEIEAPIDLYHVNQTIRFNDSVFLYQWIIEPVNDSTSTIRVQITDQKNSFANRLSLPFKHTDFEKRTRKTVLDFNDKLKEHISRFKVSVEGISEIKPVYCAFVSLETDQIEKARGMMKNYSMLSSFLLENKVELKGRPFIVITDWDMKNDSIKYDFCYPIVKRDSLPKHALISYRAIKGQLAIKAVYNGNYISSDRAWYALLDYAAQHHLEVFKNPVEIFHNNPNMGGDELKWNAEIFMPLKD